MKQIITDKEIFLSNLQEGSLAIRANKKSPSHTVGNGDWQSHKRVPLYEGYYSKRVGHQLCLWRRVYRLRQADAARKADMTQSSWSRVENGLSPLRLDVIEKMISIFGIDWHTFFEGPPMHVLHEGAAINECSNSEMKCN